MTRERGEDERNLRLFVAVELPHGVRRALGDAIGVLKRAGVDDGLRWVRPDGIHLTLKFLGATPPAKVPAIVDALRLAVTGVSPFELRPSDLGTLHGGKKAATFRTWQESYPHNIRVLLISVDGETQALQDLVQRIEDRLDPLGYKRERRPYFGHLTLARVREGADRATRMAIARAFAPFDRTVTRHPQAAMEFPPFTVDRVSLIQSTLQPSGAVYAAVETFALG